MTSALCDVPGEDLLMPVTASDDALFAFHRSDGCLYEIRSGSVSGPLPIPPGTFSVTGAGVLHHVTAADGRLDIESLHLAVGPSLHRSGRVDRISSPRGAEFVGLVPSTSGDYAAVTVDPSGRALVTAPSGLRAEIPLETGATIRALWSDGRCVISSSGTWRVEGPPDERLSGGGRITGVAEDRFVVELAAKTERRFLLVDGLGVRELHPPAGWSPIEAVPSASGWLMTCLHPEQGYAQWDGHDLIRRDGTLQLFPLHSAVVIRQTGVTHGSSWHHGGRELRGVSAPREDLMIQTSKLLDMPSQLIRSSLVSNRRLLVALHGGPDSHEWDDLRYGGLYRDAVDRGQDVLILNYPGSRGFGAGLQTGPWGRWSQAVGAIVEAVREVVRDHEYREVVLLGVSFGGWLAAQAMGVLHCGGVLASPVLALREHLRSHEDEPDFRDWAESRFGQYQDHQDGLRTRTLVKPDVIIPSADRVVATSSTRRFAAAAGWHTVTVPGGHYPSTYSDAIARWTAFAAAIERQFRLQSGSVVSDPVTGPARD